MPREEILEAFVVIGRGVFHELQGRRASILEQVSTSQVRGQNCPALDSARRPLR
jgi:hypothetical protein